MKPYDVRELLARIHAVNRRGHARQWHSRPSDATVTVGNVHIDLAAREIVSHGEKVSLTKKEFDVLTLLARHRGLVLSRERILREVWETTWKGLGRSLEVHVASIRRKVGDNSIIETVRGVGYRLAKDEPDAALAE